MMRSEKTGFFTYSPLECCCSFCRNVVRHRAVEEEFEADRQHYRPDDPEKRNRSGSSSRRRGGGGGEVAVQAVAAQDTTAAAGTTAAGQGRRNPAPATAAAAAAMSTKSLGGCRTQQQQDDSQQYCLRWNNHRSNLLTVFEQLLQTEAFTDVTLAVGGTSIKCHKMVLAACSSYFQSLFLENACPHPIVVFKDIQYAEIRAILEYMYRGEVNVAQEQLPSLLKVAEALRVKGLFEDDSLNASSGGNGNDALYNPPASSGLLSSTSVNVTPGGLVGPSSHGSSSGSPPSTSTINAHPPIIRSTSGHHSGPSSSHLLPTSSSTTNRSFPAGNKSPSPTSPPTTHIRGDPETTNNSTGGGSYSRHQSSSYLYKSPLLSPQGSEQGGGNGNNDRRESTGSNPLSMWPPLVMPLHLGAFETALREREQALALYGAIQRGGGGSNAGDDREASSGNGRDHHYDNGGSNNGNKRKRLSAASVDSDQTPSLLRTVLGPHHGSSKHHHHADIPGLFPFRLSAAAAAAAAAEGSGSADDRNHLSSYLPMAMAYAEVKFYSFIYSFPPPIKWIVLFSSGCQWLLGFMSCSPLHARVRVHALKDGKIGSTCRERERERVVGAYRPRTGPLCRRKDE